MKLPANLPPTDDSVGAQAAASASVSTWSEPLVAVAPHNLRPALYYAAINGRPDELAAALKRGARLGWTDMGKVRVRVGLGLGLGLGF